MFVVKKVDFFHFETAGQASPSNIKGPGKYPINFKRTMEHVDLISGELRDLGFWLEW